MAAFLVPSAIAIASEFFPVLATKLGGARGRKVADHVLDVAATVAGMPKNADAREIIASLRADEAKTAEVRLRLEELDQAEHQRTVEDRADARRYQASVGGRARMRGTLMLLGVVAGLVACIVAVFQSADAGALALLTTIAGALLKMLSDAFAFEFGSSAGSKEKDAHIESIQRALIDSAEARNKRLDAEREPTRPLPPEAGPTAQADGTAPPAQSAGSTTVRIESRDFVAELVALSA